MARSTRINKSSWLKYLIIIAIITFIFAFLIFSFVTKTLIFAEEHRTDETNYTYQMEEIIVNLKEGSRYLKVGIALGYNLQRDEEAIVQKEIQVRDAIITLFRNKSVDELMLPENEAKLKKDIEKRLNEFFSEDIITGIYFKDFLIQ